MCPLGEQVFFREWLRCYLAFYLSHLNVWKTSTKTISLVLIKTKRAFCFYLRSLWTGVHFGFLSLFVCKVLFHCRFKKKTTKNKKTNTLLYWLAGGVENISPPPTPRSVLSSFGLLMIRCRASQVWIKRQIIKGSQKSVTVALSWMRAEQLQPHERQLKYQPQRSLLVFFEIDVNWHGTRFAGAWKL